MKYRLSTPEEINLVASYITEDYHQCTKNLPDNDVTKEIKANLENDTIDMFMKYKNYFYSTLETGFGYKIIVLLSFGESDDNEEACDVFTSTYVLFPDNKICEITNAAEFLSKKESFESLTKGIEEDNYFNSLSPKEKKQYLQDKLNEENTKEE